MNELLAFMRSRLVEVALLTAASAALFSTVVYGFHVDDELRALWPAIIGLPLVLNLYFTAISYTPRSVIGGAIGFTVGFGAVAAIVSSVCGHAFFYDEYGNTGFYLLLGTVTTLLGFLMTRRKALMFVYAVGGCFTCGLIQFLYMNNLVFQAVVFIVSAVALCIVCSNRLQDKRIASGDVKRWQYLVCGLGVACAAVALASAVFMLVVVPLDPPAREIKLVTEYYALETVHVRGEKRVEHQEDDSLVSDSLKDGDKLTNLENGQTQEVYGGQSGDVGVGDSNTTDPGSKDYNTSVFGDSTSAIDYFHELSRLLYVVPVLLLVVLAAFLVKLLLRRRRFRAMCALPARSSIAAFYRFFSERLPLLGIMRNESSTPFEHARSISNAVGLLERNAEGATFMKLTQAYCSCMYGKCEPSDEELDCCKKLYRVFYGNARKLIGPARYFRRFFRL